MKTLLLLRHGKSSWDDPNLEDFDRPLNDRGVDDSEIMGKYAKKKKVKADLVLSSPATRAKHTTELFVAAAHLKNPPVYDERLYEASARRLLSIISAVDDENDTVLLVGHNPGLEDLCERLSGDTRKVPTAALIRIDLKIDKWSAPKGGNGKLAWRATPKKLKKNGLVTSSKKSRNVISE
ncbi:MAG TPA: histidine phosphatase family protein [Pyrinomonadaceae bacterium]|jgi:phosphohistidine phosphatase|nr:histidine phosphatase family protein [Pyrinomonadaceae bacterium]